MLIQELKEILQDQARIFQDIHFQCSKIHQLTIMYALCKNPGIDGFAEWRS